MHLAQWNYIAISLNEVQMLYYSMRILLKLKFNAIYTESLIMFYHYQIAWFLISDTVFEINH